MRVSNPCPWGAPFRGFRVEYVCVEPCTMCKQLWGLKVGVSATAAWICRAQTHLHVEHQVESITYFANSGLRFQSDAKFDTEKCLFKWFLRTWSTNGRPKVVPSLVCHRVGACMYTSLKHGFVWGEVLPRSKSTLELFGINPMIHDELREWSSWLIPWARWAADGADEPMTFNPWGVSTNQLTNQPINQTDTTDQVSALPGCLSRVRLPVEAYF